MKSPLNPTMPTILFQLDQAFRAAIRGAFQIEADGQVGVSQNENFGDYQSNAAMGLAKKTAQKPRDVAQKILEHLDLGEMAAEKPSIAGPGFINVRLSPQWLGKRLEAIRGNERLGIEPIAEPKKTVVDYSGPNVAKEMHVGHLRSTIIGDAISRILEFLGNEIVRQNHIGDWGTQFGMLIAYAKKTGIVLVERSPGRLSVVPQEIRDLEAFYREAKKLFDIDSAFQEAARQEVVALQAEEVEQYSIWHFIVDETRIHFEEIYRRLGVKLTQADERGESSYNDELASVIAELRENHIAVGSDGAIVVHVPGYESPLIIQKSDGGYLYGTTDLAAIRYRIVDEKGLRAKRVIYVHDSRQAQHFAQVFWTAEKVGWAEPGMLVYTPFGTMLGEDGKPFKTRSGGTVKLKDLLDEAEQRALKVVSEKNPDLPESTRTAIAHAVGIGGVKYSDLAKDRVSDYVFSFDKMLALDGNTAPYLQYAHARIRSIFRKGGEDAFLQSSAAIELRETFELTLAKHILRFGEVIETSARELKPHHLCGYLYELATRFSSFYENCPVLQSKGLTRQSRLWLCELAARTMAKGLDLLGIEHPEQM
jgi:arginyl-tRNA synthetase